MKHHPDRGGDEKVMKAVNKEWEDIKNTPGFDKMAYLIWKGYQLK